MKEKVVFMYPKRNSKSFSLRGVNKIDTIIKLSPSTERRVYLVGG
ncbi:hypothetical protein BN1002_02538 [Bacillus sp. B-jedd]|nr:hypothetical protein BN1002_02538 [Bacillus sp. B-jedd]